jgi:hypothetical protein
MSPQWGFQKGQSPFGGGISRRAGARPAAILLKNVKYVIPDLIRNLSLKQEHYIKAEMRDGCSWYKDRDTETSSV